MSGNGSGPMSLPPQSNSMNMISDVPVVEQPQGNKRHTMFEQSGWDIFQTVMIKSREFLAFSLFWLCDSWLMTNWTHKMTKIKLVFPLSVWAAPTLAVNLVTSASAAALVAAGRTPRSWRLQQFRIQQPIPPSRVTTGDLSWPVEAACRYYNHVVLM